MNELLRQLHSNTEGKYRDIRLRKAILEDTALSLEFSCPVLLSQDSKEEISEAVNRVIPKSFSVKSKFFIDKFDCEIMQKSLLKHIEKNYLPFYSGISSGLSVTSGDNNLYRVVIKADDSLMAFLKNNNVIEELSNFFEDYTVFSHIIETETIEKEFDLEEEIERISAGQALLSISAMKDKRVIEAEISELLIGGIIKSKPMYIADVNEEMSSCTVCGKIKKTDILTSKKEDAKFRYICKAVIEDFTGSIEIVLFCGEKLMPIFRTLNAGEEIVVFGSAKMNSGNMSSYNSVIARSISRCRIIPAEIIETRSVPESYLKIKPFNYENNTQLKLLSEEQALSESFINTSFVVFDLETTGLTYYSDKIIEVGAVKIVDGRITECFHTLINPERPINPEASKISGITDIMVKDSPRLSEVMGDFFKFCNGSTLIAHNIGFDYAFIKYNAHAFDFEFDHDRIDTIALAKSFFDKKSARSRPHNYKLQTIAASLDVATKEAHRALDDARVCAEVFLKIVNSDPALIDLHKKR